MAPQQWVRPASDPLNGKRQQKDSNQTPGGSWWPHLLAATSLSGHFSQCTMLAQCDQKWQFSLPRLGNKMHFSCHLNWYLSFCLSLSLSLIIQFGKASCHHHLALWKGPSGEELRCLAKSVISELRNRSSSLSQTFKWLQPWSRHPESEPPAYATPGCSTFWNCGR